MASFALLVLSMLVLNQFIRSLGDMVPATYPQDAWPGVMARVELCLGKRCASPDVMLAQEVSPGRMHLGELRFVRMIGSLGGLPRQELCLARSCAR